MNLQLVYGSSDESIRVFSLIDDKNGFQILINVSLVNRIKIDIIMQNLLLYMFLIQEKFPTLIK